MTAVKGVHFVRAGKGATPRWYIYAWRGGPLIRKVDQLRKPQLTPEDLAKIAAAATERDARPTDTVAAAITAWRRSPEWQAFEPGTQRTWGHALDRIRAKWGEVPIRLFGDHRMTPRIVAWRDEQAATPRTADIGVMVLRRLLAWARLRGLVAANSADGIPTIHRPTDRAPVIWTDADLAALLAVARTPVADAVRLAALTGLRRADLVALRWDEVGDVAIVRTAAKRSARKRQRVTMPVVPALRALLAELRDRPRKAGVDTVLVNSHGQDWSGDGFDSSFRAARDQANGGAGIWHVERDSVTGEEQRLAKRLHDLRGTFATHLMTLPGRPLTDEQIADLMGWSPRQVVTIRKIYVDDTALIRAIGARIARQL